MKNLSLGAKILIAVFAPLTLFIIGLIIYLYVSTSTLLMNEKKSMLKDQVQTISSILTINYEKFKRGEVTEKEAKEASIKEIDKIRYAEGKGYFWITDYNNIMVLHPFNKKLNGKDLSSVKDAKGNYPFPQMTNVVRAKEAGFVSYWWNLPGTKTPAPKLSYVKGFREWKWIVGTGVYVNDVKDQAIGVLLTIISVTIIAFIVIATAIVLSLKKIVERPVLRLSEMLSHSAEDVTTAATEISGASSQLASSSNEQASSIEQTSASIEELTNIIQGNVQNAENSRDLSVTVSDESARGNEAMDNIVTSINRIKESTSKISDLVSIINDIGSKTDVINEIAFQTKLLSFNASVEAERAGEHGRGFAVVAQEVANLAKLSANSASEISEIVKNSISAAQEISTESLKQVSSGHDLIHSNAKILEDIKNHSDNVLKSSKEILTASKEQSLGIDQINQAVAQFDKTVQKNASSSEETASASEELSAQARNLNSFVVDLVELVKGIEKKS